jgi:hypothetical protein
MKEFVILEGFGGEYKICIPARPGQGWSDGAHRVYCTIQGVSLSFAEVESMAKALFPPPLPIEVALTFPEYDRK